MVSRLKKEAIMQRRKATLRDRLAFIFMALTYRMHGPCFICGFMVTGTYIYAVCLDAKCAGPAWPVLVGGLSLFLLGVALWLRERRENRAFEEDLRRLKEETGQ